MPLSAPFFKLPVRFDSQRLAEEALRFEPHVWRPDRIAVPGYSSINLVSFLGTDSDSSQAPMSATPFLDACPYIHQVLASFDTVFAEVRLRRLAGKSDVPTHYDSPYQVFNRIRIHIPIVTDPGVRFVCDGLVTHMGAGDAWVFDRRRPHGVTNATHCDRIHLILDTVGSSALWKLLEIAEPFPEQQGRASVALSARLIPYEPLAPCPQIATESLPAVPIVSPSELGEFVVDFLPRWRAATVSDLAKYEALADLLAAFEHDWRCLWVQHGPSPSAWPQYRALAEALWVTTIAVTGPVRTDDLCSPGRRLFNFLQTGAFNPQLGASPWTTETTSSTRFQLVGDVVFRLTVRGLSIWSSSTRKYVRSSLDELVLLQRFARPTTATEAFEAAGLRPDPASLSRLRRLVGRRLLLVLVDEPPLALSLVSPPEERPAPGAAAAHDEEDSKEHHGPLRLKQPIVIRLTGRGVMAMWVPKLGEYRLASTSLIGLLAAMRGTSLARAASEAEIEVDSTLIRAANRLLAFDLLEATS